MEDRDFFLSNEYHRHLIAITHQEHILREARPARPGIKDAVLLRSGEYLISLGQRLRAASIYGFEQSMDLNEDCA